jgi:hypothetical protein
MTGLKDFLAEQRQRILDGWAERVLNAYPSESLTFLKGETDRFRNPVGYTIVAGLERIYDELLGRQANGGAERPIDDIVRMRAVQEFSPAEAVGFMSPLKHVVREAIEASCPVWTTGVERDLLADFARFEGDVDRATLVAVDCYRKCREKLSRIRLKETLAGGMLAAAEKNRRIC